MVKQEQDRLVDDPRMFSDVAPRGTHEKSVATEHERNARQEKPAATQELSASTDNEPTVWPESMIPRARRPMDLMGLNLADNCAPEFEGDYNQEYASDAPSIPMTMRASGQISVPPRTQGPLHPLDEVLLDALHDAFSQHAGAQQTLDKKKLKAVIGLKNDLLAERLLKVLDKDGDQVVTRSEFLERVRRLMYGSQTDKLLFAFRLHDLNGDGRIDQSEVIEMMRTSMAEENTLNLSHSPQQLAELLMQDADKNGDGFLSFREFEAAVTRFPTILEMMTRCEACWIAPGVDLNPQAKRRTNPATVFRRLVENQLPTLLVLALWGLINIGLAAFAAMIYQQAGASNYVIIARAAGACLNFNGALILIPVMRRMLTWVRSSQVWRKLPVDNAIAFHRLVGQTMLVLAFIHTGAHLLNYANTTGLVEGLFSHSAGITGLALMVIFVAMGLGSLSIVRRTSKFELFYFSHLLYFAWFSLCLAHGPVFYLWATVPLIGFGFEQILRLSKRGVPTDIIKLSPLSSGVTRLEIARPRGFQFEAGDYAFLRIPSLASHEWHPFTISSAPEQQNLTMHVRSLGNFTRSLRELAERRLAQGRDDEIAVYLDGPYGTASARIFESEVAILVGAGIGVTPFASVLQSLVVRARAQQSCPKKVYFFWLNRDAHAFEWFAELLLELEAIDIDQLVDIHIFMTDGRGHGTSAALNLARAIAHDMGKPDLITGLRAKTNLGRADWSRELSLILDNHLNQQVDLFFCGPTGLGASIHATCSDLGIRFYQEHF